ncbi:uncharacterized protein LACBIDRAFT_333241 [Laccaria bicolor S238N-H82]|uniref:Predicted protein n=1 Tax=Laccaria bicolor (strain S238N-H82 / ATCC MYA-4686) TaxID=486041 RepID=B0DVC5_LACBS|nr:uncharacterized protein LACBIDRAFT_333241 [Laccaria bicolor S238N-H82]EDR01489.1 predicted protein [Laccaria bicolor S238N-H82]|eukprot:XP_001887841.1 predicted protein [Laccaria bicolor S238N-H82]
MLHHHHLFVVRQLKVTMWGLWSLSDLEVQGFAHYFWKRHRSFDTVPPHYPKRRLLLPVPKRRLLLTHPSFGHTHTLRYPSFFPLGNVYQSKQHQLAFPPTNTSTKAGSNYSNTFHCGANNPAGTGRAKKSADKVDPHGLGPRMTDVGMEWEAFLEVIAEILEEELAFLFVDSVEWHWIKPTNSMFLSLCSRLAYISMMKKFKRSRLSQKYVSGSYIVIRMDEPVKKPVNHISH